MNDPNLLNLEESMEIFINQYLELYMRLKKYPNSEREEIKMRNHLRSFHKAVYIPYKHGLAAKKKKG